MKLPIYSPLPRLGQAESDCLPLATQWPPCQHSAKGKGLNIQDPVKSPLTYKNPFGKFLYPPSPHAQDTC